jgi:hypothetical protein
MNQSQLEQLVKEQAQEIEFLRFELTKTIQQITELANQFEELV